jgi:DNA-binding SARP family transcriptional activator
LRKVLDPARSHQPDHYISAHANSLELRVDTVAVDVVDFLHTAAEAIEPRSEGEDQLAEARLSAADRLYTGDFLEEDPYEDWTVDCREAARAAALEVSRLLARAAHRRGDDEGASRHLRRLLERDPYDEGAWLALVAAQSRLNRHGEARRQHMLYARRMAELDIAPVTLARTVDASP